MKQGVAIAKYVLTLILYGAFLYFAFSVNEKMKVFLNPYERVAIIGLAILGCYFAITKIMEYISEKLSHP